MISLIPRRSLLGKVHANRQEIGTSMNSQALPQIGGAYHNPLTNSTQNTGGYYLPRQFLKNIPIVSNSNGFAVGNSRKTILPNIDGNSNNQKNAGGIRPLNMTGGGGGSQEVWAKPRLITIVRATEKPRKKITILLNRKALHSFEQFVFDISDAFGLPQWKNDKIRRLYTIRGRRVQGISDFFREEDMYIGVSGKEPLKANLILDLLQEMFPDNQEYAQMLFSEWESSRSKSRAAKPRYSSMDRVNNSPGINSNSTTQRDNNGGIQSPSEGPAIAHRRGHYSVDFDENGRKKRKKKLNESDILLDIETQRQRERIKLIEVERKKRDNAMSKQSNDNRDPNKENKQHVKRINLKSPSPDNNNNTDQLAPLEKPKLRRKPKFKSKPSVNSDTPLVVTEEDHLELPVIQTKHIKTSSNTNEAAQPQQPLPQPSSRMSQVKSKSPAVPKDLNKEEKQQNNLDQSLSKQHQQLQPNVIVPPKQETTKPESKQQEILPKIEPKTEPASHKPEVNPRLLVKAERTSREPSNKMKRQISNISHVTDKYEILKTLGDGNFAVVKQAKHKSTEVEYAIKIIDKSKMKGKENMIENEIYIMKSCDHPNIVKLYEEFETKEEVYLVTDLVKGGDLFDAISQSVKFNEKDAACMIKDLCEALFYMHAKNIVHRDLKPENLLVMRKKDDKISIKLADFGLAMEVFKPIFTVCGTPTYVAPEILSEIGYGLEVDMWACGVITYILLCGFPPFRSLDRNQEELFQYIQAGEFEYLMPYWEGISESSKDLINHLLVVDIKKRWKAEDVLCHPWIISQGNSKPLPPNFEEYKKEHLNELKTKAKLFAAEPLAPK